MMGPLKDALDRKADAGEVVQFWLRDDDATVPGPTLERLLAVTDAAAVPVTLAVIPKFAGAPLADRLAGASHVTAAVHGWAHVNHAGPGEKSQELGAHRPVDVVVGELRRGMAHLKALFPAAYVPVLVPPWNRIAPQIVAALPSLGFEALSVFGPERTCALPLLNTHVDLIEWRGNRGGRMDAAVVADLCAALHSGGPVGLLTHHLVHDDQAWGILDWLFAQTADHPGCRWVSVRGLLPLPRFPADQQT